MRNLRCDVAAVAALFVACLTCSVALAREEPVKVASESKPARNDAAKIVNASRAMKEISAIPKRKIPPVVLKEASAVVVVPKAAKNAFMVSGGKTGGVLMVRDKDGVWSSPVFISISGGTLGWQIVGDPMDIVLLFKNSKQIDAILKGKLVLDRKVKIVPGWVALTMKGASKEELEAEIASYVLSHGVFVEEAVVAGTTLQVDAAANDAFYGTPKIDAAEILSGKVTKSSVEVSALQKLLTDYAAVK
jgi:lipid-binding SYLF domain-containing protein